MKGYLFYGCDKQAFSRDLAYLHGVTTPNKMHSAATSFLFFLLFVRRCQSTDNACIVFNINCAKRSSMLDFLSCLVLSHMQK